MIRFAERLKAARKMSGFSMEQLAATANIKISKQSISKYENNKMKPDSSVIIAFANALNVSVDYFFRPNQITLSRIEFRKKSTLSQKKQDMINYITIDFLERYFEIESLLNIEPIFKNPVHQNKVKTIEDLENASNYLRKQWGVGDGCIAHLIELIEEKNIKVCEVNLDSKFDAFSAMVKGIPVISLQSNVDLVRKRFNIAHELGHILLDFSEFQEDMNEEKACHRFAGSLLLPKEVMFDALGKSRKKITMWELKKMKGLYGISIQAIMKRAKDLGIIKENTYTGFNIYMNKMGLRFNEPGDYKGKEKANRFEQLVYKALAEDIISYSKASQLLKKKINEVREVNFF